MRRVVGAIIIVTCLVLLIHGAGRGTFWRLCGQAGLNTALHRAIVLGKHEEVSVLLGSGAEPNGLDRDGRSALEFSARVGDVRALKLLLAARVDVNVRNSKGRTALLVAAEAGNAQGVTFLAAKGADMNAVDPYGWTPLLAAVHWGDRDVVALLIDKGAEVNFKQRRERETALSAAVGRGNVDIAELLIRGGAEVNARDTFGRTALHNAADRGHTDMAALLLRSGALVNPEDENGKTPLQIAAERGCLNLCALLRKHGGLLSIMLIPSLSELQPELQKAAIAGDVARVEALLEKVADVNVRNMRGITLLHWAAYNDHLEVARLLLSRDADVNAEWYGSSQDDRVKIVRGTSLDIALHGGNEAVAAFLRQHGGKTAKELDQEARK